MANVFINNQYPLYNIDEENFQHPASLFQPFNLISASSSR